MRTTLACQCAAARSTYKRSMRMPWDEEHLGASTSTDVVEAVMESRSVLKVQNFADPDEVAQLVAAGLDAAKVQAQNPLSSSESRFRVEVMGRKLSVGRTPGCAQPVQDLAFVLVQRAIAFVQTELHGLSDLPKTAV